MLACILIAGLHSTKIKKNRAHANVLLQKSELKANSNKRTSLNMKHNNSILNNKIENQSESDRPSTKKAAAKRSPTKGKQTRRIRYETNALGREFKILKRPRFEVLKYPYKVTRCDQIVKLKADFIIDMGDYRKRATGYFTITSHFVNLFRDKEHKILLRSVLTTTSPTRPTHIRGAKGCVLVKSPVNGDKDITICLNTLEQEEKIQNIFEFFGSCQGDMKAIKRQSLDKKKLTQALLKCAGGKFINPKELLRRLNKAKQNKVKNNFLSNYYHPGDDRIPGSPPLVPKHVGKPNLDEN